MTSATPVQRSYQPSYQANWELVTCAFVIYPWMEKGAAPVSQRAWALFSQLHKLST